MSTFSGETQPSPTSSEKKLVGSLEVVGRYCVRMDISASRENEKTSSSAPSNEATRLAEVILEHTREDLTKADTKASILFAVVGVVVGALVASSAASGWTPNRFHGAPRVFIISALVSIMCAITLLGAAIYPRIRVRSGDRVTFFGQVVSYGSPEALQDALNAEVSQAWPRATEQLLELSKITLLKYRLIQGSVWFLALSVALGVTGVLWAWGK